MGSGVRLVAAHMYTKRRQAAIRYQMSLNISQRLVQELNDGFRVTGGMLLFRGGYATKESAARCGRTYPQ